MVTHPTEKLTSTLTMQPLDVRLRQDIRRSLLDSIEAGSVFPCRATPLCIFRNAVSSAMGQHSNRLAKLVEDNGSIDPERPEAARALDHYKAIRFTLFRAVAAIQGSLAEMLALGPIAHLVAELNERYAHREIPWQQPDLSQN